MSWAADDDDDGDVGDETRPPPPLPPDAADDADVDLVGDAATDGGERATIDGDLGVDLSVREW